MKRARQSILILIAIGSSTIVGYHAITNVNLNPKHTVGEEIDSLNGVSIYYNGGVNSSSGRNLSESGYNLGIRYQCVEFVKRYFYERYGHEMPDTYGHAKHFFDNSLRDGEWNRHRAMYQYKNPSKTLPRADDLLVLGPSITNPYGHVGIVSSVTVNSLELAQQNAGPFTPSRVSYAINAKGDSSAVDDERILGWLRLKSSIALRGLAVNGTDKLERTMSGR